MADATQVQRRRGTSAQCESMTPVEGEIIVDLTNDTTRVGDGTRAGGYIQPNFDHIQRDAFSFAVAGGTGNALTLSVSPSPLGYTQPLTLKFRASNSNTGATTIDVNSLGVKNIQKWSSGSLVALSAGDIVSGGIYEIAYDGVQFQLLTLYNSGLVSVSQGNINTSTGTFSGSPNTLIANDFRISTGSIVAPGGQYGFSPEVAASGSSIPSGWFLGSSLTSFAQRYTPWVIFSSNQLVYGQQRYVTSSPPFNMGDGEVGGFIFLLINSSGEIVSHYCADVPPWGYNGPTSIRADYICPVTKKKFKNSQKKRTLKQIIEGVPVKAELEEITDEIKNADMNLIPHPFGIIEPGYSVLLLDPMSDKTQRLVSHQNNQGASDIIEIISKGHLKIDNDPIKRSCPNSVKACKFSLKVS